MNSPVAEKYISLGYNNGILGGPTCEEKATADGKGRCWHFQNGSIYFHPETGAHEIHGAIADLWRKMGAERSFLGYPTSDELILTERDCYLMGIGPFDKWHGTSTQVVGRYGNFVGGIVVWCEPLDFGGAYFRGGSVGGRGPMLTRIYDYSGRVPGAGFWGDPLPFYWKDFQLDRVIASLGSEQLFYKDAHFLITDKRFVTSIGQNATFLVRFIEKVWYEETNRDEHSSRGLGSKISESLLIEKRRIRFMIRYKGFEEEVWNAVKFAWPDAWWRMTRMADALSASMATNSGFAES